MSDFTFSEREFQDLLADESCVNIDRLREASRYGVPESVRSEVWKILLGVKTPDKSEEMSARKEMEGEFAKLQAAVRHGSVGGLLVNLEQGRRSTQRTEREQPLHSGAVGAMRADIKAVASRANTSSRAINRKDKDAMRKIEHLLLVYLANNLSCSYRIGLVHLLRPFVHCTEDVVDAYYCFSQLMTFMEHNATSRRLDKVLAQFLMLFRRYEPELCTYLEDEELNFNMWAIPWFKGILATNLPLPSLMRLWDTYFAIGPNFDDLHLYVCLAILRNSTEDLMDLEHSELLWYLQHLPTMDMDQIIMHAKNLFHEVASSRLL